MSIIDSQLAKSLWKTMQLVNNKTKEQIDLVNLQYQKLVQSDNKLYEENKKYIDICITNFKSSVEEGKHNVYINPDKLNKLDNYSFVIKALDNMGLHLNVLPGIVYVTFKKIDFNDSKCIHKYTKGCNGPIDQLNVICSKCGNNYDYGIVCVQHEVESGSCTNCLNENVDY